MWDPRQKNDPVATMEASEGETKRDVWAVAFGMLVDTHMHMHTQSIKLIFILIKY